MASKPDGISYYYYGSWVLVLFIWSYLVRTLGKRWSSYGGTGAQLPTPPGLPIVGHLHHLLLGSTSFAQKLHSLATRYGPLLQLHMGASKFILVSDPNFAKEILKTHELNFLDRPDLGNPDYNIYFRSGLFQAPYGTYWRFMKKLCMTRLLCTPQLNQFSHIRDQELTKLLQYLIKVSTENESCDLSEPLTALSNNVICRMAMSTNPSDGGTDEAKKIKGLVDELVDIGGKLSAGDILGPLKKLDLFGYGRKFKKLLCKFDQFVEEIIKKHEENSILGKQGRDLMDILLETYDDPNAEVKLTKTDIKALLLYPVPKSTMGNIQYSGLSPTREPNSDNFSQMSTETTPLETVAASRLHKETGQYTKPQSTTDPKIP
ncbi:Cytochrome P450 [Corchorus olitorius]|uniref:Cytochrome P450 n=1 Tax=Corchorus olitorius TaxID=93759 RepID=A0A1R3H7J5_9ROSI|nr:Cytochrome P450 [Corchorus olitorius]